MVRIHKPASFQRPVVQMVRYRNSLRVDRRKLQGCYVTPGERGHITYLSRSALNRLAFTATNASLEWRSLLTLTYSAQFSWSGEVVKRQLNRFLTGYRRRFIDSSYLWFLEFQQRGAPHFHLLSMVDPDWQARRWVAHYWSQIAGEPGEDRLKMVRVHLHEKTWERLRSQSGGRRYAVKYALKPHQKKVPEQYRSVGRFWGCSFDVTRSANEILWYMPATEHDVRLYLRSQGATAVSQFERLPWHIWLYPDDDPEDVPTVIRS